MTCDEQLHVGFPELWGGCVREARSQACMRDAARLQQILQMACFIFLACHPLPPIKIDFAGLFPDKEPSLPCIGMLMR